MAFTFVGDLPEMFNAPLLQAMTSQTIKGIPDEWQPIYYLVGEYDPSDPFLYDGFTWYIKTNEEKSGLITDFKFRWNTELVPQTWHVISLALKKVLIITPFISAWVCMHYFSAGPNLFDDLAALI